MTDPSYPTWLRSLAEQLATTLDIEQHSLIREAADRIEALEGEVAARKLAAETTAFLASPAAMAFESLSAAYHEANGAPGTLPEMTAAMVRGLRARELEADLLAIRGAYLEAAGTNGTLPELVGAVRRGATPVSEDDIRESPTAEVNGFMADPDRVILRFDGFDVVVPDEAAKKLALALVAKMRDVEAEILHIARTRLDSIVFRFETGAPATPGFAPLLAPIEDDAKYADRVRAHFTKTKPGLSTLMDGPDPAPRQVPAPVAPDLDLPPGMTRSEILAIANRQAIDPDAADPCQELVSDLLPEGWKIETDVGPDIRLIESGGNATVWWKLHDCGLKATARGMGGAEGILAYLSDVRRLLRAVLAHMGISKSLAEKRGMTIDDVRAAAGTLEKNALPDFQPAARAYWESRNAAITERLHKLNPGQRLAVEDTDQFPAMLNTYVLDPGEHPPTGRRWTIYGPRPWPCGCPTDRVCSICADKVKV